MPAHQINYSRYFQADQHVNLVVQLSDQRLYEETASIKNLQGDHLILELFGDGLPNGASTSVGAKANITGNEAWALCRCHAILMEKISGLEVHLQLEGQVELQQRREYFRQDMNIPLLCDIPSDQQHGKIVFEWEQKRHAAEAMSAPELVPCQEGFKVVDWGTEGIEIEPLRVNLSGNGVRIKLRQNLPEGTLVHLALFLPLAPGRVIHAVGSVVRCNEIQLNWEKFIYYLVALKFEYIDEDDRETIIGCLFNEQRKSLRQKAENRR